MLLFPLLVTATVMAGAPQQAPAPSTATVRVDTASTSADSTADADDPSGDLPVSVDRIRRKLSRPPAIKLNTQGTVFRVEVLGELRILPSELAPQLVVAAVLAHDPRICARISRALEHCYMAALHRSGPLPLERRS